MKIEATNALEYIRHIKIIGYLSGKEQPEDIKNYSYCSSGEEVYKQLVKIEARAHRLQELSCNGEIEDEILEKKEDVIKKQVLELLPRIAELEISAGKKLFFLNGDPRGYTLKCHEEINPKIEAILNIRPHTDWGSYFIIAPEF